MNDTPSRSPEDPVDSAVEPIGAEYDWTSTAPSIAVIETVAVAPNERPTETPASFGRFDPNAPDASSGGRLRSPGEYDLRVTFPCAAREVCVVSRGEGAAKRPPPSV